MIDKLYVNFVTNNLLIKEYKNGCLFLLVGPYSTIRIFITKISTVFLSKFNLLIKNNYIDNLLKFYLLNFIKNNLFLQKKILKYIKYIICNRNLNLYTQYKNILWFKGRSFQKNLISNLFINRGRIFYIKLKPLMSISYDLSKKQKFLRIKSNSFNFLQLYIYMLFNFYKPSQYTGKGLRIRGKYLKKRIGKRKTH